MKIRLFLAVVIVAGLAVIGGCGKNVATSGSSISVEPTSITWNSLYPYVTNPIYTTVLSPGGEPMNGLKVTYWAPLAAGSFTSGTGFYAFLNKNGTLCQSPCVDTTDSNGMSVMNVLFCTTTDCPGVTSITLPPLPAGLTYSPSAALTYTDTIYVSSGSATPVAIDVKINGQ